MMQMGRIELPDVVSVQSPAIAKIKIIPDMSEYRSALDLVAKSPELIQGVLNGSIDLTPVLGKVNLKPVSADAFDGLVAVKPSDSLRKAIAAMGAVDG